MEGTVCSDYDIFCVLHQNVENKSIQNQERHNKQQKRVSVDCSQEEELEKEIKKERERESEDRTN